jgi:hypothetical protein
MLFVLALLSIVLASATIGALTGSVLSGHPRAALRVSAGAAAATFAVIGVHIAVPIIHQSPHAAYPWLAIAADYFMAMGHRIYGGPYAFMWTPWWIYQVSTFTPLVAPGAAATVGAAFMARCEARAAAPVLMAVGTLTFIAFVVFAFYVAFATLQGVPV